MTKLGWAIGTGEEKDRYLGGLWFSREDPTHHQGFRIAVFETRTQARAALAVVKGPADCGKFPKARIVRVRVTLKEKP